MSPSPRIFAAAGLLLLPLGIWWAVDGEDATMALSSVKTSHSSQSSQSQSGQWEREMVFQESFDVGSGTLDVEVSDADVEIRSGSGRQVVVEGWVSARDLDWGREVFRRSDFRASRNGSTVSVDADDPRVESSEWRRNRGVGIIAIVTVPIQFNVRVSTSDGDVDVEAVRGNVEAQSSDGDIKIEEVTGGRIILETSDGDISVASLTGDDVRIETSDGDIDLRSMTGPLEATTSDGDIMVRLDGANNDVALRTGDGDITIYAPATMQADVTLEGEDVEVSRGFALQGSMGRRVIRGTLNGGGGRVSARTGDGEIALRTRRGGG